MPKCPFCGAEIDPDAKFCIRCGSRVKFSEPIEEGGEKIMKEEEGGRRRRNLLRNFLKAMGVAILASIILISIFFSSAMFVNVPVGYGLILVDPLTKSIQGPILGPTWYLKAPWVHGVLIYYAVDSIGMWGDGTDPYADYPAVKCFSSDQLEMTVDVMVRWKLDPDRLLDLYRNYPNLDWKDKTIASVVRQTMRFVTANFTAVETVEKREYIAAVMKDEIWKRLQAEETLAGAIAYFEFDLRNIGLPPQYTAAIEAKLVAEQQKLQAEFERSRILILANASAQEKIIKAQGEAMAKIIVANGTREAIRMAIEAAGITNSSRIAELYLWVEALKEISPNVNVLIITTGETGAPIIYQLPTNSTSSP
ncbi:zinc-ribbon domain-containing protein [Candidatus Bathyarchaeota archaeon]|nr:MAG: zinc-ribbon domain-containing protein [Candidatus Bathyarchaeota archaeon]